MLFAKKGFPVAMLLSAIRQFRAERPRRWICIFLGAGVLHGKEGGGKCSKKGLKVVVLWDNSMTLPVFEAFYD